MDPQNKFAIDLTSWARKFSLDMDAIARQTCQQISQNVVMDTPVNTGNLRSSWQPSIGEPEAASGVIADQSGSRPLVNISMICAGMKAGDKFWMTNNAVYALRVEFGFVGADSLGRIYNQRGQYFLTRNMQRSQHVVDGILRELTA